MTRPRPHFWYSGMTLVLTSRTRLMRSLVPEQADEAEREQAAVDLLDAGVVVEQAEHGPDGPAVDLGDRRHFRGDQVLQRRGHVIDFALRTAARSPTCRRGPGCRFRGTAARRGRNCARSMRRRLMSKRLRHSSTMQAQLGIEALAACPCAPRRRTCPPLLPKPQPSISR